MALIAKKVSISDDKALDDLIKRAKEIKEEHSNLKREAAKDKSGTMSAKLAAKEEQLERVANAIRAKRAEAHSSVSLVVDVAPARLDIDVLLGTTGQPVVQMRGRGDLIEAMISLLKKDLKGKVTGTSSVRGGMLMTFKDIKLPELSTKAEDAKERVLNDLGDNVSERLKKGDVVGNTVWGFDFIVLETSSGLHGLKIKNTKTGEVKNVTYQSVWKKKGRMLV